MFARRRFRAWHGSGAWLLILALAAAPRAHAQFEVFDPASFGQLMAEASTLNQELTTVRAQLVQARAQLQAMTGGRGMQLLLSGTVRNYLPTDQAGLAAAASGGGTYGMLSADVQTAMRAFTVLSGAQLAGLSSAGGQELAQRRQAIALSQAVSREALSNSSSRFGALQQLVNAIGAASDQKAALDLQARIVAEQGMLQNEQTKLQALYQGALAGRWAAEQRMREQVIAAHGSFGARFQPVP
jgi:type IV secretion system protein VirB5